MPANPEQIEEIRKRFYFYQPKGDQGERYGQIRSVACGLAELIADLTPYSREQSLAITNLEQAVMWANAAIARNE